MRSKIAANVASEKSPILRVMPLFVKNLAMKAAFDAVGECKACLCMSNLGVVQVPEVMRPYIRRFDFVIGPQAKAPHNCAVATWDDTVYVSCVRNIKEPELELHFYKVLHALATDKPTTIDAFGRIPGIGEFKRNTYGKVFTQAISRYLDGIKVKG